MAWGMIAKMKTKLQANLILCGFKCKHLCTAGMKQRQILSLFKLNNPAAILLFVAQTIPPCHKVIYFFFYREAIGCKDWIISPCFIFHVIKSSLVKKKIDVSQRTI